MKLKRKIAEMEEDEADLQRKLQHIKVSVTHINSNLWYSRLLFFFTCCRVMTNKLSAESHCKTVLILITKVLAAKYITITIACVLIWLNVYTSCLTHHQRTWGIQMGEQKYNF